jgi:hypothetical protein
MKASTVSLLVGAAIAFWGSQAIAQGQPRSYAPAQPTVSPYLNLLRRDTGPVTNYYTLVRPQQQQQAFNRQQQANNQQQQSVLQTQQQGIRTVQQGLLQVRQSQASPTGRSGGFMNYSHYYNFSRTVPNRQ